MTDYPYAGMTILEAIEGGGFSLHHPGRYATPYQEPQSIGLGELRRLEIIYRSHQETGDPVQVDSGNSMVGPLVEHGLLTRSDDDHVVPNLGALRFFCLLEPEKVAWDEY